jgi:hypothetical protein
LSSTQNLVDSSVSAFLEEATDWKTLVSMSAGGVAGRMVRLGILSKLPNPGVRMLSLSFGLGAEASTFEFSQRALGKTNSPQAWRWDGDSGLGQGLLRSFMTFGLLKGAGAFSQNQNFILQHLFQDSAVVLGCQVSEALGIAPSSQQTLAERFLHAETMNLQMIGGMNFVHALAPRWFSMERSLDHLILSKIDGSEPWTGASNLVFAGRVKSADTPPRFPSSQLLPPWAMSENKNDKSGSNSPPELEIIDEGWEGAPPSSSQNPGDRPTPPWTPSDASALLKQALPSNRPEELDSPAHSTLRPPGLRSSPSIPEVFRSFLLVQKSSLQEVEEGVDDFLAFCGGQEQGREELYLAISEVRQEFKTEKFELKLQHLYTYTRLTEGLKMEEIHSWKEFEALGEVLRDPELHQDLRGVLTGTFLNMGEALFKGRPGIAHDLKSTYEVLRELYTNPQLPSEVRTRAMTLYTEFRTFSQE